MRALLLSAAILAFLAVSSQLLLNSSERPAAHVGYIGFDRNDYPGDSNLKILRQTFSYSGYWLNNPPGAKTNSWRGKRKALQAAGFGFLVLFNGRTYAEIKSAGNAAKVGQVRCCRGGLGGTCGRISIADHHLPRPGTRRTSASRTTRLPSCVGRWRQFRGLWGRRVLLGHCRQGKSRCLHRDRGGYPGKCRRAKNKILGG